MERPNKNKILMFKGAERVPNINEYSRQQDDYIDCLESKVSNLSLQLVSVSDSEIESYANNTAEEYSDDEGEQVDISDNLQEGAKWMRDKLTTHSH